MTATKLRELGARHVAYGAEPAHDPIVGKVLIASMRDVASTSWRAEYERAWAAALDVVAGAMLEGAADAGCAPPPEAPTEQNGRATPVCG